MTYKEIENELNKYGLKIYHKERRPTADDPDDGEPIDFSIDDGTDNVAWVWGSEPFSDYEIECNHPDECIEWGDDDECGECLLCGDQCTWGWVDDVVDEGYDEDGNYYLSLLLLLIEILLIVNDLTYRRICLRTNLHQIKTLLISHPQGITQREYTLLWNVLSDKTNQIGRAHV